MKKQNKKTIKAKVQKYPAHHLALILIGLLVLEGVLISSTTRLDWSQASRVLDMSQAVSQTISNTAAVFQPMADTVSAVNQFYVLAAAAMTPMFDLSDTMQDMGSVFTGVSEFYQQAATQMASVLDISNVAFAFQR